MESGKVCPLLLNPSTYVPDSVDLLEDAEARKYWLSCLEGLGHQLVSKAHDLNRLIPEGTVRSERSRDEFHQVLHKLKDNPSMLGSLSVRYLLDINEEILRENGLKDAYKCQKHIETKAALLGFKRRVEQLDTIQNRRQRIEELCKGIVAGNMFDWGAKAVVDLLKESDDFGLDEALTKIQPRPWLIDDLEKWTERLERPPYKCIVIFVDNAGIDFILGVLPLTREFLKDGSTVMLCANSKPALNDITHQECENYLSHARETCSVISQALDNNKLQFFESGSKGPCIDLSNLHPDLCEVMVNADLVILEGMGRAVHTNLYAQFKVDCLKVAVIKNDWWAKRLGGEKFSVLFQYEPVS